MTEWLPIAACIVGGLIAAVLVITWLPAMLIKRRQLADLRVKCKGKLALTYDDGPGPKLTQALADLLKRYDAKATFFLVGFRALRAPQVCDLLAGSGHQIGCHTHMHKKPWRVLPWTTGRDVNDGYEKMGAWLARDAAFRPPFGKLTLFSWLAAKRRGAAVCWWTHDGCDTHASLPDPALVAQHIMNADGAVVLLHSHDRGEDRHRYVLALSEQLLNAAREKGLEVCTMSRVLENPDQR